MNNIVANYQQILKFAAEGGLPPMKQRGIIREYLQSKFISVFYTYPQAKKMSFVGGTALRLLRNQNRFSEDLDFDNLGLTDQQIISLVKKTVHDFELENIKIETRANIQTGKTYFELRFPNLLFELKITANPREKLMIKINYTDNWKGQKIENILMNRYGFVESISTNSRDQLMVQKLTAYTERPRTQPRDIYDVVWLYAQGTKLDKEFLKINGKPDLLKKATTKFEKEGLPAGFNQKLAPFLFVEKEVSKMRLFPDVLKKLNRFH